MNEINLDYLAGFIDGEGHFTITKNLNRGGFAFRMGATNTDLGILLAIQKCYGGFISEHKWKGTKITDKKCWSWVLSGNKAVELSKILKEKLIIKKGQAEIFSKMITQRSGHRCSNKEVKERELARADIKYLNHCGREFEIEKLLFKPIELQKNLPFIQN